MFLVVIVTVSPMNPGDALPLALRDLRIIPLHQRKFSLH